MDDGYQSAKSIAVTLIRGLKDAPLTTEVIAAMVEKAVALDPRWAAVDRTALTRDIETQFNVWIGRPQVLDDQVDHTPWLAQKRGQLKWQYWERYKEFLKDRWPAASIDALEQVTDEVLERLEDPAREGSWDRRGLVVGHVQSGKTANYVGLINKAVDAGYRVIVVLAGVHKSLRSQTQVRLDEGFLGYESAAATAAKQGMKAIGVGRINPALRPNTITNRSDDGDFKQAVARNFQINPGGEPLLFVIKKNASVLKNLLEWVDWASNSHDAATKRPIVRNVPLLVIDDEADHASVDTKIQVFNEDGEPDPDHDPTIINRKIRRLLHCFEKVAYVGYTATPFANIFIHESGKTTDEGEDLFPRSFIINLPAPSDYVGPLRVFGLDSHPDVGLAASEGLPIIRAIDDVANPSNPEAGWMPPRHKKDHVPRGQEGGELPDSLREAIRAFILSCAARRVRGQIDVHNSMLIHVTRYTAVQEHVFNQVKAFLDQILLRLKYKEGKAPSPELGKLKELWEGDFVPTSEKIGAKAESWQQVERELWSAATVIKVKRVNGTAPDILDYETHRESGLSVIAIGGDKLARGLTLEGLTVSYFLRAAKMYDTLMQMGRWFGYRPGYVDLCRMYMPDELEDWFMHVTAANEELRQEFDRMSAVGGTPREYGLRVQSHPALLITSRVKMRNGQELNLSYAGDITETTVFRVDEIALAENLKAVEKLVATVTADDDVVTEKSPHQSRPAGGEDRWFETYLWKNVKATTVAGFLKAVATHELARKVNGKLMAEFIEKAAAKGELTSWTVALLGKKEAGGTWSLPPLGEVSLIERQGDFPPGPSRFTIKRLLNPRDEAIDLDLDSYEAALKATKKAWSPDGGRSKSPKEPEIAAGPMIRQVRPKERALLLLYLIDYRPIKNSPPSVALTKPLLGFAVSFPASATGTKVVYKVNNVYWQQEYGVAS